MRRAKPGSVTKELDAILRSCVMARDGNRCRRCGKEAASGRGQAIETAHIYPKGKYPSMRYRMDNVLALCHACHHHFAHKDPINFALWVRKELGDAVMTPLAVRAAKPGKTDRDADRLYLRSVADKYGVLVLTPAARRTRIGRRSKTIRRNP